MAVSEELGAQLILPLMDQDSKASLNLEYSSNSGGDKMNQIFALIQE